MAKIMQGWGSYCSVNMPNEPKYYLAYLRDPREPGIVKLSRKHFWTATEAREYSTRFVLRYERLLTAAGLCGRLDP